MISTFKKRIYNRNLGIKEPYTTDCEGIFILNY